MPFPNPNSPTIRGLEFQPTRGRIVTLRSPLRALAQRIRGTAATIAALHSLTTAVEGNPGMALEVVTDLDPSTTDTVYYPGTDTGSTTTGWTNSTGTTEYALVDDQFDLTDYMSNTNALSAGSSLDLDFRGSVTSLSGVRILSVTVGATVQLRANSTSAPEVNLQGYVTSGASKYLGPAQRLRQKVTATTRAELATWDLSPNTGAPWTLTEINALLSSSVPASDEFGIRVSGKVAASGFRVHGLWLTVTTCTENRIGYYYAAGQPRNGWVKNTLSGTSAMSANTSYWLVMSCPFATVADYVRVPTLKAPDLVVDDTAAGTGEHRQLVECTLGNRGGVATSAADRPGQLLPMLYDVGGTIQAGSNPFATFDPVAIDRNTTTGTSQQITTAAATTYAAVIVVVGWANTRKRPDRPLKIEMRSGSASGTLRATARLFPKDTTAPLQQYVVKFDAAFAAALNTQYWLVLTSDAKPAAGWNVVRLDTRSDLVTSGGTTTVANVEQASMGGTTGQTDSYEAGGTANDRYDLAMALVASPTAPAGFAATVVAAT